ncbi:DNA (cytosine-5-)-methyltransferase [Rhodococcus fascians]|nr:DNA (cytosine-5-)-methyltransferase [Rhodococcus fascians]MBY3996317.1 DNA (cytosine-5-)-methyltransferase [Rhodococcus fascians]MBY4002968.1 DNA (cytosine-5-)-methyltransferase [Rhodococcus fascians]MBY4007718.1 DNA (cytosine-5-)-methyltransferase [Rhodococcus fascians]MBY4017529.1 DNA (cytosine-5-)-methyltransferase [Rhodococcus fascians]
MHCTEDSEFLSYASGLRASGHMLVADLFSGAGGLSLGLEDAGYKVVLSVDHDAFAVETHRHHFGGYSTDWDLGDPVVVQKVADLVRAAGIDIISGGPPCQPFSKAGRSYIRHQIANGLRESHDRRRDLWQSYIEIVGQSRPKVVIMENVPDMALDREMFILRSMVEQLESWGYSVEERVIETWRYGVPQFRQRLILVAIRDGVSFEWPKEEPRKVTVWNAIGDLPEVEGGWRPEGGAAGWSEYAGPVTSFQESMRATVPASDGAKVYDHITRPVRDDDREAFESMTHETKYSDLAEHHQRYRSDIFDDKYKRLDENDLSRTITAHIAKDGYWYIHPRQSRTLTVREAARLQTFPDSVRFAGPPSAAFKQIGNAVPPRLGRALGLAVKSSLILDVPAPYSTQTTSRLLAEWFRSRPAESLVIPWLETKSRWLVLSAELVLDRASVRTIRAIWPVLSKISSSTYTSAKPLFEILQDMADGVGRGDRARLAISLFQRSSKDELLLTDNSISASELGISQSIIDLSILCAPEEASEEPVLVTKGVLRVARRFQGGALDQKNRLTDGRMAIARMIGMNTDSRDAHRGLIELASSLCKIDNPLCSSCPLERSCLRDGVANETVLF